MTPEISMKIREASTRESILNQYQNIKPPIQKSTLQTGTSFEPPQPPVSAPAARSASISPVMPGGQNLRRGEKFTVADANGAVPANLRLVFRWNIRDTRCDLDASAFLLTQQGKVMSDGWFIFYGQPVSPDQSVQYSGNTGTGAELQIHLQSVSPAVQKIALAVTIYEAFEQKLHFGMVQTLEVSLVNADDQKTLAVFHLTDCSSAVTAMVVGELYRYKGAWKFNAVGSGVSRDLAGFCAMYGIETG